MENINCEGRAVATNNTPALPGPLEILAIIGFGIIIAATFIDFTPVVQQNWRASGVGLPVALSCLLGAFLIFRRNYFAGFFIAVFAGFFLTHEIIIIYDNKAVELGKELMIDGWFRPVLEVYRDAFTYNTGAFWALVGVLLAVFSICTGWVIDVVKANNNAARIDDYLAENATIACAIAPTEEAIKSDDDVDLTDENEEEQNVHDVGEDTAANEDKTV